MEPRASSHIAGEDSASEPYPIFVSLNLFTETSVLTADGQVLWKAFAMRRLDTFYLPKETRANL